MKKLLLISVLFLSISLVSKAQFYYPIFSYMGPGYYRSTDMPGVPSGSAFKVVTSYSPIAHVNVDVIGTSNMTSFYGWYGYWSIAGYTESRFTEATVPGETYSAGVTAPDEDLYLFVDYNDGGFEALIVSFVSED